MSEGREPSTLPGKLCKAVCALLLAASVAACDACGHFVPPIRLHGVDLSPDACRDTLQPK